MLLSRISPLTPQPFAQALTDNPQFSVTAMHVLNKYPGRQDIVVRLTYCLGNLMAKCDQVGGSVSGYIAGRRKCLASGYIAGLDTWGYFKLL